MVCIFKQLWRVNFQVKLYNPIRITKLLNCNITDVEEEWNKTKQAPKYFNFFQDVIQCWESKEKKFERKEMPAFWYVDEKNNELKWSFQDLVFQTKKMAQVLKSSGLERDDKMIVILPKIPEWWLIILASFHIGIVSAPGTTQLRSKDILYRINSIQAKCIVADWETSERVDQIAKNCPSLTCKILCSEKQKKEGWIDLKSVHKNSSPLNEIVKTKINDTMVIYFTSGSTGHPKPVRHTHENSFAACINRRYLSNIQPNSLTWNLSDTGWAKICWGSLFFPWSGGSGIFIHHSIKFDPIETLKILQDYPITNFCAPATAFKLFIKEDLKKYKFPYLKYCISAGESVTKEVITMWKDKTGLMIHEFYGQSETSLLCSTYHCKIQKPGSIGLPGSVQLTILDEKCGEVKPFEEGEIAVKLKPNYPLGLFKEYMNSPSKTEEVFKEDYYLTGDRGYRDDDGYFWFVGRKDDIISSSGYRIGPHEVESALHEHPAVKETAVVASPDPLRGEVVKAFIILTEKYLHSNKEELIKELQEHTKNITSPYKYPRKIEFVETFPRTISGKIQRFKLREWEREASKFNVSKVKV